MAFTNIQIGDKNYPPLLAEIPGSPQHLFLRGIFPNPKLPIVAIVGTRKATKDGRELAKRTAEDLARSGVVVVSGLALGIDSASHIGALDAKGITVAVLANGIDSIYPATNQKLADRIISNNGAIVSEYGPGEPPFKNRFIERNRIISGLSIGVVVIEAPSKSGALTTARFAGEQGRYIFVFPGGARNPYYAGSHSLIRDGATLVTNTNDILEDLGIETAIKSKEQARDLTPDEYNIVQVLTQAGEPINVDMIIELTTLEPHIVNQVIATLTIYGITKEVESGYEISNS